LHIHKTLGDFKTNHIEFYLGLTKPMHTLFDIGFSITKTRMAGHLTFFGFSANYSIYWGLK